MTALKHLTIGTIFYNNEWCIDKYLQGLLNLKYPKAYLDIVWVDSSDKDNTYQRLKSFQKNYGHMYNRVILRRLKRKEYKTVGWMRNIARARNKVVKTRDPSTDLIFIDSDCVPPPYGIHDLLHMIDDLGADIAGGITIVHGGIAHNRETGEVTIVPTFSLYHHITKRNTFYPIPFGLTKDGLMGLPIELRKKIIRVKGMACGFMYIRKEVLDVIKFRASTKIGEDLDFCKQALEHGFELMGNTDLWYDHLHYLYEFRRKSTGWVIKYYGIHPAREQEDRKKLILAIDNKSLIQQEVFTLNGGVIKNGIS